MTSNEVRAAFLTFFERNGHRVVPSSTLVPHEDPTLLFTNAGMNQFKDVFLGADRREYTRAASSQKCVRAGGKHNDLENVGRTARHLTFFEMLGNFSFGDYFKADAIRFAWELLLDVYKLDVNRLWFTVFEGDREVAADDDAAAHWVKAGAAPDRVLRFGKKDNFWSMGDTGPCGPCTEIHYFRGSDLSRNVPELVNAAGDDTMEIWNLVFMQYDRDRQGRLAPLPAPSVDTGAGLERLTSVLQQVSTVYDTDSFSAIMKAVTDISGHRYGGAMTDELDTAARVICDHSRSTVFLIGDGVVPSNEGRGYVLRKIMRRAMRHGKHLGLTEPFLHRMVDVIAGDMGDAYPDIRTNREVIEKTILAEEDRFEAVLTQGLPRLEAEIQKALGSAERTLPGEAAFRLYDTFGVPFDFIEDTAATQGVGVDREAYERAMEGQRDRARAGSAFGGGRKEDEFADIADESVKQLAAAGDQFDGYASTRLTGVQILSLFDAARRPVDRLSAGETGYAALARTPFYLEAGGQVSDAGRIVNEANGTGAVVEGLVRIRPGLPRAHRVRVESGALTVRDVVTAEVDVDTRDATRRNHTATHLLHAALRKVLGPHVKQAGSLVAPDRLRFDFFHFQAVSRDELDRIERIVNSQIVRNTPVQTEVQSTNDAIAAGAMALFGEKYGDRVRVVSVPGFSMELCGGTHVSATGDIGFFVIVSEGGVAAGVRRIEALTGAGALRWAQEQRAAYDRIIERLKVNPEQAVEAIERLQADAKRLARELTQAKTKLAMGGGGDAGPEAAVEIGGIKIARRKVADLDKDAMRALADSMKAAIGTGVVVLASASDGRVQIVVAVTPDLTDRLKAGHIVKEIAPIVGGGGGGRPDFAEAGGKQPEKIDELLAESLRVVEALLTRSR
ncbi:MAG TPA: alanine--tRNA ligase [Vicinamibacterales bacterium]|nr:alanine--tRNA ligase [Vicinamibacterales bacterium]